MIFIGVSGSRELHSEKLVWDELDKLFAKYVFVTIVSGEARGADTFARNWALSKKSTGRVNYIGYPAKWRENGHYDPLAGFKRNQMIVDKCDILIAFLVKSLPCKGTRDTIKRAGEAEKRVIIVEC